MPGCTDNRDDEPNCCRSNCEFPGCPDGQQDTGEACDDGNSSDNDLCTTECVVAVCGDTIVCDDPTCTTGPGNGPEQCDDGNSVNDDGCSNVCGSTMCGDGIVTVVTDEMCDDNNCCSNGLTFPYPSVQLQDCCLSDGPAGWCSLTIDEYYDAIDCRLERLELFLQTECDDEPVGCTRSLSRLVERMHRLLKKSESKYDLGKNKSAARRLGAIERKALKSIKRKAERRCEGIITHHTVMAHSDNLAELANALKNDIPW
jgi:hypothetical protein